jgi:hypothetical protein
VGRVERSNAGDFRHVVGSDEAFAAVNLAAARLAELGVL